MGPDLQDYKRLNTQPVETYIPEQQAKAIHKRTQAAGYGHTPSMQGVAPRGDLSGSKNQGIAAISHTGHEFNTTKVPTFGVPPLTPPAKGENSAAQANTLNTFIKNSSYMDDSTYLKNSSYFNTNTEGPSINLMIANEQKLEDQAQSEIQQSYRQARNIALQGDITSIKKQASDERSAATVGLAGSVISGGISIAGGASSMGMLSKGAGSGMAEDELRAAQGPSKSKNPEGEVAPGGVPKSDPESQQKTNALNTKHTNESKETENAVDVARSFADTKQKAKLTAAEAKKVTLETIAKARVSDTYLQRIAALNAMTNGVATVSKGFGDFGQQMLQANAKQEEATQKYDENDQQIAQQNVDQATQNISNFRNSISQYISDTYAAQLKAVAPSA